MCSDIVPPKNINECIPVQWTKRVLVDISKTDVAEFMIRSGFDVMLFDPLDVGHEMIRESLRLHATQLKSMDRLIKNSEPRQLKNPFVNNDKPWRQKHKRQ